MAKIPVKSAIPFTSPKFSDMEAEIVVRALLQLGDPHGDRLAQRLVDGSDDVHLYARMLDRVRAEIKMRTDW